MQPQTVVSSIIRAVGFDPSVGRLRVVFRSGSVYDYESMPVSVYARFSPRPVRGGSTLRASGTYASIGESPELALFWELTAGVWA
ncbi:KTSC domain-containing protein [Pseudonocardia alni]|uniref:KTSC domain-containing protein n=1 Tax=Pseudonocardia alni TaxID=33907 RepID=UPI0012FD112D